MIVLILPDITFEDYLLEQARQGSVDALRQIYEHYFPPIYQFIRLRVEDVQIAEDLAGNVFLKLVKVCRQAKAPHKSLRGWLFRVARSELHDHYGKNQRLTQTVLDEWIAAPPTDDPEVQFMHHLDAQEARYAIQQLSPDQQEVLILRFGQMLSLQETADIMGKNANAVKALQFRAASSLRRILAQMRGDEDESEPTRRL